jgi:AcrR family transcriptional regulator
MYLSLSEIGATQQVDNTEQAGVSKGALYLYYKSKDAIIAALLQRLFTQEFNHLKALVESEG